MPAKRGRARPLLLLLCLLPRSQALGADPPALSAPALAALYSLGASAALPFPNTTLANASSVAYVQAAWALSRGRIENGANDMAFVADPFAGGAAVARRAEDAGSSASTARSSTGTSHRSSTAPSHASSTTTSPTSPSTPLPTPAVLRITYPAGSYSHQTGGAEFYSLPLNASSASSSPSSLGNYTAMLLSYEVAFSPAFNWVEGGKLPGLRGGPDAIGCSGGTQPTGADCFSVRLMWRQLGEGEVYAYIPTPDGFCAQPGIICNSDYGVSVQRGSFNFTPGGTWQRLALLVQLNDPPSSANGLVELYVDGALALRQTGLVLRTSGAIAGVGGLFFSTFFGGSDSTWATPTEQHTFFRNVELWAGAPANNASASGPGSTGGTSGEARRCGGAEARFWLLASVSVSIAVVLLGTYL